MNDHAGPKGRIPVRQPWLDLVTEEALLPDVPIIDPHHHLWDRPRARYLLDEFRADLACGHRIEATVHVEAGTMHRATGPAQLRPVGETEFAAGMAAISDTGLYGPTRICAGIVGFADLRLANVAETLDAHIQAAGGRFRGIRQSALHDAEMLALMPASQAQRGLLADTAFRAGFACLAPRRLSFDSWTYADQLNEVADLAGAFPDTTIIVNHLGGILAVESRRSRLPEVRQAWEAAITRLAVHNNVVLKLGGLGMWMTGSRFHMSAFPPSSSSLAESWRPWIETAIEVFGPGRCMFESNFPVDKGSFAYGVFWNACKRMLQAASEDEVVLMLGGTARRIYRL